MTTLVELTANIVTSNVSGTGLSSDELVAEINKVFVALKRLESIGTPEVARQSPPEEPMVLTFSSPVYTEMDVTEIPAFEEELARQYKNKMTPEPAPKLGKKAQKPAVKPGKPAEIPARKAAVKETAASNAVKEKRPRVKA